jgi:hypothetical protein
MAEALNVLRAPKGIQARPFSGVSSLSDSATRTTRSNSSDTKRPFHSSA